MNALLTYTCQFNNSITAAPTWMLRTQHHHFCSVLHVNIAALSDLVHHFLHVLLCACQSWHTPDRPPTLAHCQQKLSAGRLVRCLNDQACLPCRLVYWDKILQQCGLSP
jgi:hypothetical protein